MSKRIRQENLVYLLYNPEGHTFDRTLIQPPEVIVFTNPVPAWHIPRGKVYNINQGKVWKPGATSNCIGVFNGVDLLNLMPAILNLVAEQCALMTRASEFGGISPAAVFGQLYTEGLPGRA